LTSLPDVRLTALLRGINVGTAKRVAMADVRALVSRLGYRDVRTLLNSGNVVFSSARPPRDAAARIQQALSQSLGVSSRVIVISARELATIVRDNPLLEIGVNHSRLMVAVTDEPIRVRELQPLMKMKWSPEALALGSRAAYTWCPDGVTQSPLFKTVAKNLGDRLTTRNWTTITKLHAMVAGDAL
jgi:uncharacterized protein (DUF1697 family)